MRTIGLMLWTLVFTTLAFKLVDSVTEQLSLSTTTNFILVIVSAIVVALFMLTYGKRYLEHLTND